MEGGSSGWSLERGGHCPSWVTPPLGWSRAGLPVVSTGWLTKLCIAQDGRCARRFGRCRSRINGSASHTVHSSDFCHNAKNPDYDKHIQELLPGEPSACDCTDAIDYCCENSGTNTSADHHPNVRHHLNKHKENSFYCCSVKILNQVIAAEGSISSIQRNIVPVLVTQ